MIDNSILSRNLNDQVSLVEFFQAFGYKPNDTAYLRRFKDKNRGDDPGHNMEMPVGSLDSNKGSLEALNKQDFGIFWVVNGDGQRDKQVKHARAQFTEIDPTEQDLVRVASGEITIEDLLSQQLEKVKQFPLEPSIMIRTWKSIYNFWLLKDGDIKRFRGIQKQLVQYFGSDPVIVNESRVLRLPGFEHRKHDPVMVKLIKFNPELKYTQDELQQILSQAKNQTDSVVDHDAKQHAHFSPDKPGELIERDYSVRYVSNFLKSHDIEVLGQKETEEQTIMIAVRCPWEHEHSTPTGSWDSVIMIFRSGIIRYYCLHSHCDGRTWTQYKQVYSDEHKTAENDDPEIDQDVDLEQFHLHNLQGRITGVYDYAVFDYLRRTENIFVCGGTPYIYQGGFFQADMSGAELKTMIRKLIYPEYVKAPTIKRIYELFTGAAELQVTPEDMNKYPVFWINFRNAFYDALNHCMVPHDPKYRATNQIPHMFDPAAIQNNQIIKNWLTEITPKTDDREMLLQYAGYCMTRDTRQQKFLILRGEGGTGKSTVIRMIEAVVGAENISNISLSQLTQRFSAFGLMGKLVNSCADLEVTALEDTSIIKKILGEDRISAEAKGKDAISFRNYSKLIFSTNELPIVKSEKTNGFYRRLLVLTMDTVPTVKKTDIFSELSTELDAFIHMSVNALERMLQSGNITESKGSIDAVQQLRNESDTVSAFLDDECKRNPKARSERSLLYLDYSYYCQDVERQALTKNNFYKSMRLKGFPEFRTAKGRYFGGVYNIRAGEFV